MPVNPIQPYIYHSFPLDFWSRPYRLNYWDFAVRPSQPDNKQDIHRTSALSSISAIPVELALNASILIILKPYNNLCRKLAPYPSTSDCPPRGSGISTFCTHQSDPQLTLHVFTILHTGYSVYISPPIHEHTMAESEPLLQEKMEIPCCEFCTREFSEPWLTLCQQLSH